jgi:thioredoxin reductase (NADPH)
LSDIAVIGAGPAGIAASIYLKRAGFEPFVFEKRDIGGLLLNANLVENYPGFPEGISGKGLVRQFKEQLSRLEVEVNNTEVITLTIEDGLFKLKTDKGEHTSRAVIVATGTIPKSIDIQGEADLLGRKLFYEIKDITQYAKEDTFVIIGGGDAAFDYALNLSGDAARVDVIFRSERAKCLSLLEERAKKRGNIQIHPKTQPLALKEEGNKIKLKTAAEGKEHILTCDYMLIAAGREPNLSVIPYKMRECLKIEDNGCTNLQGLFIAGDVRRGHFRQTGIAVGDGILCAMSAERFLRDER